MNGTTDPFSTYRDELLRWNRRFSLLGRRDPERTFDNLLLESRQGLDSLLRALHELDPAAMAVLDAPPAVPAGAPRAEVAPGAETAPGTREAAASLILVDIGSGNGMPGLPWHLDLKARLESRARLLTVLVEPRRKRAWFLERTARRLDPDGLRVIDGRWEDGPYPELAGAGHARPRLWILALRALALPEQDVVRGWLRHAGPEAAGDRAAVVRFRPAAAAGSSPEPAFAPLGADVARSRTIPIPGRGAAPTASLLVNWYPPGSTAGLA